MFFVLSENVKSHIILVQIKRQKSCMFVIYFVCFIFFLACFFFYNCYKHTHFIVSTRETSKKMYDLHIQRWLKREKGKGCLMPKTDPFDKDMLYLANASHSKIACPGKDWVTCDNSECFVTDEILHLLPNVECYYSDMIYVNDNVYYTDNAVKRTGKERYKFDKSDHVKIFCTEGGPKIFPFYFYRSQKWNGIKTGFRPVQVSVPPGREDSPNVLILAFDSVSHNQFLRRLPQAYRVLTQELGAVVLNNYNIVGDATPAAMFPILTGKSESELPDARKIVKKTFLDPDVFLFKQLHRDGYRTAYFEDQPHLGTFQLRYNGFKHQPSDHYLRSFMLDNYNRLKQKIKAKSWDYLPFCVGATPTYILLMNLTRQFTTIHGKRFSLTFISDVSHNFIDDDEYTDLLGTVEDDLIDLLRSFKAGGILENTLVFVMSDHGSRYTRLRLTYQGKIEERLPFVSIILPERLKRSRPDAVRLLRSNANVLTTPFDIHTTILDVVGLNHLSNDYKVNGSDLPRGMSLLEPIPTSRSCSEAYIYAHWCACLKWETMFSNDPVYKRAAEMLAGYINSLAAENVKCSERTLLSIDWVKREMGTFRHSLEYKNVRGSIKSGVPLPYTVPIMPSAIFYQVKIKMSPGKAIYEGTMSFFEHLNKFVIFERDISRVDAYGSEPNCVIDTHPHLSKYCYCKNEHSDCC